MRSPTVNVASSRGPVVNATGILNRGQRCPVRSATAAPTLPSHGRFTDGWDFVGPVRDGVSRLGGFGCRTVLDDFLLILTDFGTIRDRYCRCY